MDSFTMEIEKDKRDEQNHVQEVGRTDSHSRSILNTEADLSERDESLDDNLEDDEHRHVDYSNCSKGQLVALVKELARESDYKKVDRILKEIKPLYDEI